MMGQLGGKRKIGTGKEGEDMVWTGKGSGMTGTGKGVRDDCNR